LNNGQVRRVENTEPYALFGDIKQDYFAGGAIPVGTNTLSLELYSQDKGRGDLLASVQIDFSID
ncbi:MAG: hypothetical protein AAGA40_13365, partial [Cyanobacteria bacterium P01_E01_bin.45]